MKLTLFLSMFTIIQLWATESYSQLTKLTLKLEDVTISDALKEIENHSEFFFLYSPKLIDVERKVNIDADNESIKDILSDIFKEKVKFEVHDRQIILTPNEQAGVLSEFQQQNKVTGIVTDKDGKPLPGVNVVVTGTTQGTITDIEGKYSIEVSQGEKSLTFTFVGMQPQEVTIGTQTQINVTMAESAIDLQEVVVIGYGTQKKINLTGALTQITSEALENKAISSTAEGLQGIIPNLNITFSSGDPVSPGADFNIRGFESISGGSPLILVDGVSMDINLINPSDIESVTVLKDAAASGIYGARAAFGVILVTTKKSGSREAKFHYDFEYGLNQPIENYDVMDNLWDFVSYKNTVELNRTGQPYFSDNYMAAVKAYSDDPLGNPAFGIVNGTFEQYSPNNWKDILLRNSSPFQNHNLNVSGGYNNMNYYISVGYFAKEGLLKVGNEDIERLNLMTKMDFKVKDWLKLNYKVAFNNKQSKSPHYYKEDSYSINSIIFQMPTVLNKLPYIEDYSAYEGMYFYDSSEAYLSHGEITNKVNDLWLSAGSEINLAKGLRMLGDFSYNLYTGDYLDYAPAFDMLDPTKMGTPNMITQYWSSNSYIKHWPTKNTFYSLNISTEYEKTFKSGHYIKALAGFNQEYQTFNTTYETGYYPLSSLTAINLTSGTQFIDASLSDWATRGVFYRLNYIYKNRYLFEATGRYDGTSKFPKSDRFGFFPAFSAGWRISEENFMAGFKKYVDNLKIRASYGKLGNQLITNNNYPYISGMNYNSSYPFIFDGSDRTTVVYAPSLVSPSLTWESVTTKNIGIDLTTLKQRLNISFDTYVRTTTGMLQRKNYPEFLMTVPPYENGADLDTKGWEFSVSWNDKSGKDFKYSIQLSLSDWTTKITKFSNETGSLNIGLNNGKLPDGLYYVGQNIGEIWGYETVGIFQTDDDVANAADQTPVSDATPWKAGDIQYKDLNNDDKINQGKNTLADPGDMKIIGNSTPRYSYGVNLNTSYKGWFLQVFFQGVGKQDYMPPYDSKKFWPWQATSNFQYHFIVESWTEDNRDAYFPRLLGDTKNQLSQTRYLQNAAYIRLKSLTLGYDLPSEWVEKIHIDGAKVFFTGQNLWYATKLHRPLSPEETTSSEVVYPYQRTYSFGINISF